MQTWYNLRKLRDRTPHKWKALIAITKPGIIFGNIIAVLGGYFLAWHIQFKIGLFLSTLTGMSLVIASACVFNNYIDRDIDRLMARTKHRVLAQGLLSKRIVIGYGLLLGLLGFYILYRQTNLLTPAIALIGFFIYVFNYSLWLKRRSTWSIIIGGIAGAIPPVTGYCALSNRFDAGAILLFLILFFWQMPHFYTIAIYRLKDFAAAAIPVLPIVRNVTYTKLSILIYIAIFIITSILPSFFGYVGIIYFIIALCLGLTWFILGIQGFNSQSDKVWSRKMFLFSIINMTLLCLAMAIKY